MLLHLFMVLLAIIGTQVSTAAASRGVAGLVAAGYEIIDVQWKVAPVPGGQPVHLNGTVQDIIAKLTKLNPNWETDHKKYLANDTAADVEKRESTQTGVKKIKDEGRWDPDPCKGMDSECDAYDIMDGVDYLNKVPGEPGEGPGPRQCGRVSCSWDSAIYWCNNNKEAVTLGSYRWIANGASYICTQCAHWDGIERAVSGEAFNSNDWSVVVMYDVC